MTDNIYKAPAAELGVRNGPGSEHVLKVAARQRTLLLAVLGQILVNPLTRAIDPQGDAALTIIGLVSLALIITVVASAVRLSVLLNRMGTTIFLGLLSVVPLLNLIALLVLSRQSTKLLKESGIRVGLLGPKLSSAERKD